jgi:hypothetical protein
MNLNGKKPPQMHELPDFSIIENANSSKIKPSDERFRDVKFDDIDNFLNENR